MNLTVEAGNDISYTVSFVRGDKSDVGKAVQHAFWLVDRLAKKTKTKAVLIIDEFPSVAELKMGKKW